REEGTSTHTDVPYGSSNTLPRVCLQVNGTDYCLPVVLESGRIRVESFGPGTLIKSDFGFSATYDHGYCVSVSVPSSYMGQTCGLCGNYNRNANDDLVPDPRASCSVGCGASDNPCPDCKGAKSEIFSNQNYCGIMSSPVFTKCHPVVSFSPYIKDCLFDLCQSNGESSILCTNVATYAAACKDAGITDIQWRREDFSVTCPNNSHYELCGNGCPSTCDGLAPPPDCVPSCTEGCYCNNGFILSGGKCVPIAECGCSYNGAYYKAGQEFYTGTQCQERCTCGQNNAVRCQKHNCGPHEECAVADGQHFNTFDGHKFNIHGTCHYVNDNRGSKVVSYVTSVQVKICDFDIVIDRKFKDKILVNKIFNSSHFFVRFYVK
uniref:VWFD domain-containing protein n=1 Tax=Leptobrachium leishanense TaxID=445787 RepID=A0A8C5R390_9ANUR